MLHGKFARMAFAHGLFNSVIYIYIYTAKAKGEAPVNKLIIYFKQ